MTDPTTRDNAERVNDLIARLLLRYFRQGHLAQTISPKLAHIEDIRFLRMHWAISPAIQDLCKYVCAHRHEIQTSLDERERIDDAVIRGRLDARKTVVQRHLVGHPTLVVFQEPIKGFSVGANHVLVWTLQHASRIIRRIGSGEISGSSYAETISAVRTLLAAIAKLEGVSRAIAETNFDVRPSARALAQAASARRPLYRKAYAAYRLLQSVEQGDEKVTADLLKTTLIGPLEMWKRFELLLAIAMATALALRLGATMQIRSILPGTQGPLFEVDKYSIFWQVRTSEYRDPVPEPSELLCTAVLNSYGIDSGDDRPDVVVLDNEKNVVVAVGEAKYFTNETEGWRTAFREATSQIVRYARGYASGDLIGNILGRSLIGLWRYPRDARPPAPVDGTTPLAIDLSDIEQHTLVEWADRIIH